MYILPRDPSTGVVGCLLVAQIADAAMARRLLAGLGWLLSGLFLVVGVAVLINPRCWRKLGEMDSPELLAISFGLAGATGQLVALRRQPLTLPFWRP